MQAHLHAQRSWLEVEHLPSYAPELNPVEALWSYLKGGYFANRGDDTVDATVAIATAGAQHISCGQEVLAAFLTQTGLRL